MVGRKCKHCDRPVIAKEMCMRHYQMWHRHGDPLFADKKKVGGLPHGVSMKRGYLTVSPVSGFTQAVPQTSPEISKSMAPHRKMNESHGFRDGRIRKGRKLVHRIVANAKEGDVVHHIDLDRSNNDPDNLHVFKSPKDHAKAHRSLEKIAASLVHSGLVLFDRETGCYRLAESAPLSI